MKTAKEVFDEKFGFHINGGTTIKVRAEMVKEFVIVDNLITINNDK